MATKAKTAPRKRGAAAKKSAAPKRRSAELKTKVTGASVKAFLDGVDTERRDDVRALDKLFRKVTGEPAKMWGTAMVGYGTYHYVGASGREGDWLMAGFSPRKQNLTLYLMDGFEGRDRLLERLGPCSTGKSCLYVKRLSEVDMGVLEELVRGSVAAMRKRYPA